LQKCERDLAEVLRTYDDRNHPKGETGVHARDILDWWERHEEALPRFCREAAKIFLSQHSSAAAEQVFSLLKAFSSDQQESALEDYFKTSLVL